MGWGFATQLFWKEKKSINKDGILKKNKIMPFVGTGMELETLTLSEVSQKKQ